MGSGWGCVGDVPGRNFSGTWRASTELSARFSRDRYSRDPLEMVIVSF